MLASLLLSLREGIEAALIIGIVLGALKKMNRTELSPAVYAGALVAVLVSAVVGVGLTAFGLSLEEPYEQVFEGVAMLLAAGVLTWMIFWMRAQSKNMKSELEFGVHEAAAGTGKRALFSLAFLAVVREGIELALFLAAAAFATDAQSTVFGTLLGLAIAAVLGWGLFASSIRLNLKRFFQVTGVVLILFAAGLLAHGVHEFNEIGWIPSVIEHVWDINPILNEKSAFGALLATLFGYNGNPSLTEVLAYVVYFAVILIALFRPVRLVEKTAATSS